MQTRSCEIPPREKEVLTSPGSACRLGQRLVPQRATSSCSRIPAGAGCVPMNQSKNLRIFFLYAFDILHYTSFFLSLFLSFNPPSHRLLLHNTAHQDDRRDRQSIAATFPICTSEPLLFFHRQQQQQRRHHWKSNSKHQNIKPAEIQQLANTLFSGAIYRWCSRVQNMPPIPKMDPWSPS